MEERKFSFASWLKRAWGTEHFRLL